MGSNAISPTGKHFSDAVKYSLAITGVIVFPLLHCFFRLLLLLCWPGMSYGVAFRISTRLVSALQSIVVICVAARTVLICKDIIKDEDPLIHAYIWFAVSYFPYDIFVMYIGFCSISKPLEKERMKITHGRSFLVFFKKEFLIIIHHLVLEAFFPVVEFYKRGMGDFFVGCFFLAEISTPFYSARGIFREVGVDSGFWYEVNGLVFMMTFLVGRVLSVPLMFWQYSQYSSLPILQVPRKIPLKCSIVCLSFFLLQFYWFSMILYAIVKHINKRKLKLKNVSLASQDSTKNGKILPGENYAQKKMT